MKERVFLFIARFRDNNNVRANTFLVLLGIWFLGHALIFGFPPEARAPSSDETQRFANAYFYGRYVTNAELAGWFSQAFDGIGAFWDFLRRTSWFSWKWGFLLALGYRGWAWRDEIKRSWRSTTRLFRESRGGSTRSGGTGASGTTAATVGAAGATQTTGAAVSFLREAWTFAREFLGAVVANIATHR